jgi:DNA-directed RNA polymerase specialized sigma24 family protein
MAALSVVPPQVAPSPRAERTTPSGVVFGAFAALPARARSLLAAAAGELPLDEIARVTRTVSTVKSRLFRRRLRALSPTSGQVTNA